MANNKHGGSTTVHNPAIPFMVTNLGDVKPGKIFNLSGIPSQNPERITINFESGHDVAFVFDIRFHFGDDINAIVRITRLKNSWGIEERAMNGTFHFRADEFFDMTFHIETSCFKVTVNNQPVLEFMHRLPFHRIDTLRITGDVRLCQVRF